MNESLYASRGTTATLALRAAALSLLAATIHLWVAPDHLEEWWGYGAFFVVLATAPGLYALGLLRCPPDRSSCWARRVTWPWRSSGW